MNPQLWSAATGPRLTSTHAGHRHDGGSISDRQCPSLTLRSGTYRARPDPRLQSRSRGTIETVRIPPACRLACGGQLGLAIARSAVYNVCMSVRAMQEATFMILTALANGSQHGYGIIIDVQEISGGRVRLRAGTLYSALDRLRADELIAVDREEVVEGRLRRYYRLTPAGTRRLAAEAARLQAAAAAALTRLNLAGGTAT